MDKPLSTLEWQLPLSGVHSIMMEKLAQPGEGGGCTPTPYTLSTITYEVVVDAPAESADALPFFLLYAYMYSVGQTEPKSSIKLGIQCIYTNLNYMD